MAPPPSLSFTFIYTSYNMSIVLKIQINNNNHTTKKRRHTKSLQNIQQIRYYITSGGEEPGHGTISLVIIEIDSIPETETEKKKKKKMNYIWHFNVLKDFRFLMWPIKL
eukprot:9647_1